MATTAPTSQDILSGARFQTSSSGSSPNRYDDAPTAASILGATSGIDPSALHPLAGLVGDKDLDYLSLEDDKISSVDGGKSVLPSRGWGDELCYGTGSTYLAGLAAGGLWGLREGFRRDIPRPSSSTAPLPGTTTVVPGGAPQPIGKIGTAPPAAGIGAQATAFKAAAGAEGTAAGAAGADGAAGAAARANAGKVSRRLRWNNVLNQVTRRGSFTGNSAGVLALIYNGFNSTLDSYRGGKHDIYGSMFAGACTGVVWRCTAGIKPMIITSGLLTVGAAAWTTVKTEFL